MGMHEKTSFTKGFGVLSFLCLLGSQLKFFTFAFNLNHPESNQPFLSGRQVQTVPCNRLDIISLRFDNQFKGIICRNRNSRMVGFSGSTNVSEENMNEANASVADKVIEIIGKSTSTLVSLTFFCVLAWKRDALMMSFFVGAIGNAILSKVLKRLLDQARPEALAEASSIKVKPTDPGMPSSHAMSLGFIGMYTSLNLHFLSLPIAMYVIIALYYRVKINLHSLQVCAL